MKRIKYVFSFVLLSLLLVFSMPLTLFAATLPSPSPASEEGSTPYAGAVDWEYAVINGILCKRLFNYTTNKPLTDWIPVT